MWMQGSSMLSNSASSLVGAGDSYVLVYSRGGLFCRARLMSEAHRMLRVCTIPRADRHGAVRGGR